MTTVIDMTNDQFHPLNNHSSVAHDQLYMTVAVYEHILFTIDGRENLTNTVTQT